MESGAVCAYRIIDEKVEMTLQQAAEILKRMEFKNDGEKLSSISSHSSSSYESRKTISIGTFQHTSHQPKATIRTPRDANKDQNVFFPNAGFCGKPPAPALMSMNSSCTESSADPVTPVPDTDTLFPPALYIPAAKKSKVKVDIGTSAASREKTSSIKSVHRYHVQKLAVEPLEDIKKLKCRGVKKSQPDEWFPKADYNGAQLAISPVTSVLTTVSVGASSAMETTCNPTNASSNSYLYQPMEFTSADGRVKMMLQPLDEKKKKSKRSDPEEFPIVPKQLQSSTKLKTVENHRTKFSADFTFGDVKIDMSGIFNGSSMKKNKLSKLVINGQSYSI